MLTKSIYRKFLNFHRNIFKETNKQTGGIYIIKFMARIRASTKEPSLISEDIIIPDYNELKLIDGKVDFSYEALPYLFNLEGHDKNLLLFLFAYCIEDDCIFAWNRIVYEHYADLYEAVTGKNPSYGVIRQSVVTLVANNIIQKIETGKYMLNPLLYPVSQHNQLTRKQLIKTYGMIADNNTKVIIDSLFVEEKMTLSNKV